MTKLALIISALAAALALAGCSKSARLPSTVTIVQKNDELAKKATLVLGDTLLVEMPGDMTTGHLWELLPLPADTAGLALGEGRYVSGQTPSGGPGRFVYVMRTVHVGEQKLEFVYRRTAEKDKPPLKTFTVTVMVK